MLEEERKINRSLLTEVQAELKKMREEPDSRETIRDVVILGMIRRQNLVLLSLVGRDLP